MSKKFLLSMLIGLTMILLIIVITNKDTSPEDLVSDEQSLSSNQIVLPIPLNNPAVGSALIHYFISGSVQSVGSVDGGHQLVLANSNDLPILLINSDVRISQITPPYGANSSKSITVSSLKQGMNVDISMEYELGTNTWIIRDIFVPTDKN